MFSIKDNRIRWTISAILAVLILFGTYRGVFSLAAFLICGLMLVFCDKETNLLQMFFIMPMANIFKLSPGTQSFFTIIILVFVILHLVLPRKATAIIIIFGLYVLIGQLLSGGFNTFRTIKLLCNLLFLSSTLNGSLKINHKELFFSYIVGNLIASVFGTMDSGVFKIESYIGKKDWSNPELGTEVMRFAGLYEDPNYYAVGLIICLCLLVVLFHRKEINLFVLVLFFAPIVYFLVQTYSKSALLMLCFSILFLLYSLQKQKKYLEFVVLIVFAFVVAILALSGQIPVFDIVLSRMETGNTDDGMDINALTTGRFDLWMDYIRYFVNNIKASLFGVGINTSLLNAAAPHNTYIDIIYHLGIFGGFMLIYSLVSISVQSITIKIKRNFLNYSVILCIGLMYFFLSELFYFDPPFHIFLAIIVLNLPLREYLNPVSTVKN